MVPIYESADDRAREAAVVMTVCQRLGWRYFTKLPDMHPLDWKVHHDDGRLRGFLEVKCRPGLHFGFGDGYYIATSKVAAANRLRAVVGCGTRLVVYFPKQDEIWWTRLNGPYRTKWAGRRDRPNDPHAMEDHAVISWRDFDRVRADPPARKP